MASYPLCYVCEKEIRKDPVVCWEIVRHARCEPGSKSWMASKVGRDSCLRSYFEKLEKDGEGRQSGRAKRL